MFALFAGLRIGVARYSGVGLAFHYCAHTPVVAALLVASVTGIIGYSDIRFSGSSPERMQEISPRPASACSG